MTEYGWIPVILIVVAFVYEVICGCYFYSITDQDDRRKATHNYYQQLKRKFKCALACCRQCRYSDTCSQIISAFLCVPLRYRVFGMVFMAYACFLWFLPKDLFEMQRSLQWLTGETICFGVFYFARQNQSEFLEERQASNRTSLTVFDFLFYAWISALFCCNVLLVHGMFVCFFIEFLFYLYILAQTN